jgi:hypothetical protein
MTIMSKKMTGDDMPARRGGGPASTMGDLDRLDVAVEFVTGGNNLRHRP